MALANDVCSVTESYMDQSYETDHLWDIHASIVTDDIDLLRQTLKLGNVVNEKFADDVSIDHAGMTPLSLACALNKLPAVKLLLAYGADVNATFTDLQTTSLMTSSFHGHSDIVRLLLKKGADVQAVDQQGSTALGYAFGGSKSVDVVGQLLAAGIDVNQRNMLGMTALLLVAGYGNDRLVRLVLEAGADAKAANNFGHTALHLAIVGKRSLVKKMSTAGGPSTSGAAAVYDLNRRDIDVALKDWAHAHGGPAAASHDDELERVGKFMMMIGSRLEAGDSDSDQEAMKRRVEAVLRYRQDKMLLQRDRSKSGIITKILSCGSKRGAAGLQHQNAQAPAARPPPPHMPTTTLPGTNPASPSPPDSLDGLVQRCTQILHLLINAGCPIDAMESTFGLTALDMSVLLGDVESTATLVAAGADPDHLTKMFASSELYDAIVLADRRRVKELLAYDADLDVNHPFSKFNLRRRRAVPSTAASNGGDADQNPAYRYEGLTPLSVAAQLTAVDAPDVIKLLQKHGGDVNRVGPGGSSPLAEAARAGNLKMVQFLVAQGADVETGNPAYQNATPVVIAVINKHMPVVDFLIEAGAKIDRPLSDGRTALIKAMEAGDRTMAERLLQANLGRNFADTRGFTFEMAQKYQRLSLGGVDAIMKTIGEKVKEVKQRERDERDAKNRSVSSIRSSRITTPLPLLTSTAIKDLSTASSSKPLKDPNTSIDSIAVEIAAAQPRPRTKRRVKTKSTRNPLPTALHASLQTFPVEATGSHRPKKKMPSLLAVKGLEDGVEQLSLCGTDVAGGERSSDTDSVSFPTSLLKRWPAPSTDQQQELLGISAVEEEESVELANTSHDARAGAHGKLWPSFEAEPAETSAAPAAPPRKANSDRVRKRRKVKTASVVKDVSKDDVVREDVRNEDEKLQAEPNVKDVCQDDTVREDVRNEDDQKHEFHQVESKFVKGLDARIQFIDEQQDFGKDQPAHSGEHEKENKLHGQISDKKIDAKELQENQFLDLDNANKNSTQTSSQSVTEIGPKPNESAVSSPEENLPVKRITVSPLPIFRTPPTALKYVSMLPSPLSPLGPPPPLPENGPPDDSDTEKEFDSDSTLEEDQIGMIDDFVRLSDDVESTRSKSTTVVVTKTTVTKTEFVNGKSGVCVADVSSPLGNRNIATIEDLEDSSSDDDDDDDDDVDDDDDDDGAGDAKISPPQRYSVSAAARHIRDSQISNISVDI